MSDIDLNTTIIDVADGRSRVGAPVFGLFARDEFARARAEIADLAIYLDYDDWLDAREGLQLGLSMAGVEARMVRVGLASFLDWRALTKRRADLQALDAFAAAAAAMRDAEGTKVLAVVEAFDYAIALCANSDFARHGGYRRWLRHRRALRAVAVATGLRVEELPIRCNSFLAWCECLGETVSEAALDRYAELLLEHLTSDFAG